MAVTDILDQIAVRVQQFAKDVDQKTGVPGTEVVELPVGGVLAMAKDLSVLLSIALETRLLRGSLILRGKGEIHPGNPKDFDYAAVDGPTFDKLSAILDGDPDTLILPGITDPETVDHVMVRRSTPTVLCRCGRTMSEGDFNGHQIDMREASLIARGRTPR